MKTQVGIVILILASVIMLVYFAFQVHRILPISIQWIYPAVVVGLFVFMHFRFIRLFNNRIRNRYLNSALSFSLTVLAAVGAYQFSSIRREAEAFSFLQQNEERLAHLMNSYDELEEDARSIPMIDGELNVRLLDDAGGAMHFELYSFAGYGYRLMYTDGQPIDKPRSLGMSPTHSWYKLKENWYYYSYLD